MTKVLKGKAVVGGAAGGEAIVSTESISLWGGLDSKTGEIIDRRHECSGCNVTNKVFVFPTGRGSSTASAILLEAIRLGTAPAAIINSTLDPILALGDIVADELYKKSIPLILLDGQELASIRTGDHVMIELDGTVKVEG